MTAAPVLREPPPAPSPGPDGERPRRRTTLAPWSIAAFVIAGVGVIGWHAQMAMGSLIGYDAEAHQIYADVLDRTWEAADRGRDVRVLGAIRRVEQRQEEGHVLLV